MSDIPLRYLDNSLLSLYKDCPHKFYLAAVKGWRAKGQAAPLSFGTSYHAVLQVFDEAKALGASKDEALRKALRRASDESEKWTFQDSIRTKLSLMRAVVWYAEQFWFSPLQPHIFAGGKPALELSFQFELDLQHPAGGNYIYCGHIDKLAEYDGQIYAVERKHTTATLSDNYFDRYIYSSQIEGYVIAGNICFERVVAGGFIESGQIAANFVRFGMKPVVRVNDRIEEWLADTKWWIKQIERSYAEESWAHNKESCSKYSGCQFKEVCFRSRGARNAVLEHGFHYEPWQPEINR